MNEQRPIRIEEVESVPAPSRARVDDAPPTESAADKLERKRDYLAGFLAATPPQPAGDADLQEAVIDALKEIFDPEIPVNIYDLGLIYTITINDEDDVDIVMTLTAPGCPVAGEMPEWVQNAVEAIPGIRSVNVTMTFDPQWGMDMMSDEARLELGFM